MDSFIRSSACLEEFLELARGELSAFLSQVPSPVLVLGYGQGLGMEEDTSEFTAPLGSKLGNLVVPVVKRFASSLSDIIWIGRALTCDVILPFENISKIHAVLSRDAYGQFLLADAGSRNGTWLNGVRLKDAERLPLLDKDRVRFGAMEGWFVLPQSFYDLLQEGKWSPEKVKAGAL